MYLILTFCNFPSLRLGTCTGQSHGQTDTDGRTEDRVQRAPYENVIA